METIEKVIDTYKEAARSKNADLMLEIYTDDIFMFDAWEKWSEQGLASMKSMVDEWFTGLGEESLDLEIDNLDITQGDKIGFATFDVNFIRLDVEGTPYKSVKNRFTICLVKESSWKIKHQHSSVPV